MPPRLNVGLIGLGRLGRVYARDVAGRIPETRLVAVADTAGSLAQDVAAEFDVARSYSDPLALIDDTGVDALVIVTLTHVHREHVVEAAARKKPTFCEKPPALSLAEVAAMKTVVEKAGTFFQMGFMRRFDAGYAAAKKQIEAGRIGTPLVFNATSRDPFRPSLEYANPASSGGMLIDMGIHDFDLARWFMGNVRSVAAIGATIAYLELSTVGDIDNAIASLTFASGKARRRRPHAQRHLRLRHLHRDPRAGGHDSHRLSARNADHDHDEGQRGVARHGALLPGAIPGRLHQSAAEPRAERAARQGAANHDRRWPRGAARGVAATRARESGTTVTVADVL